MTQQELATQLNGLKTQVDKIQTEVSTALANSGQVSQEVVDAVNNLKVSIDAVDSLIPDQV